MKKLLLLTLAVAIALAGCAVTGPYRTVQEIKSAVKEGDQAKLAEYIDFALLRSNLKAQVREAAMAKVGGNGGIFGAIAGEAAGAIAGGLIEAAITPAGIVEVMSGEYSDLLKPRKSEPPPPGSDGAAEAKRKSEKIFQDARYGFDSSNQFSIYAKDRNGKETQFILTREGLKWRLTNIVLTELLS